MFSTSEILKIEKELEEPYKIERYRGENVFYGIDKETNERLTFKVIPNLFESYIHINKILQEIQECSEINHENVIQLINLKTEKHFDDFQSLIIVFQRMDTSLFDILQTNQELSTDHRRYFIYLILRGLKYLHSANVILKNLNPYNIMLDANCDLKILTLGHSTDNRVKCYVAPETLLEATRELTPSVDIWSVGCILYELIMRKRLFPGINTIDQLRIIIETIGKPDDDDLYYLKNRKAIQFMKSFQKVKEVDWNSLVQNGTSDEIDLIKMMLEWNPSKRISVDEALKHQYFEVLHEPSDEPSTSPINLIKTEGLTKDELAKCFWTEIQNIREKREFK